MFTKEQLTPLPGTITGLVCALRPDRLGKRWQRPKFQLIKITGGFGAEEGSLGRAVFGECLADGEGSRYSRGDFLGVASEEQIAAALADPEGALPLDPTDMVYLSVGSGLSYSKAKTLEEAKAGLKKLGAKHIVSFHCHAETQLTDMGGLRWPRGAPEPVEL